MSLLDNLDADLRSGAMEIVRRLRRDGHEALFAGGAVRDLLLGADVADIDIATSAAPDVVEGLFPNTISVGREFGVVIVVVNRRNYEVTTFRTEGAYLDGRHPSFVEFSDSRSDAQRRDFTVNALFLDPDSGQILDYVGGRADLEGRVIRAVGSADDRFKEDKLRVLRAVRFACRLDFKLDPQTERAIGAHASGLGQVSWERIRDELIKILTGRRASDGLRLMLRSGVLEVILPEVAEMDGVEQPPQFHPEGDVFVHTCLMFKIREVCPDPVLALGLLLHDVGKPRTFVIRERIRFDGHAHLGAEMSDAICRRLRLSNREREGVVALVRDHLKFMHVRDMRASTLKRFLSTEGFDRHLELHRLDCLASHGDLSNYDFCRDKLEELKNEPLRPEPLIGGRDLIEVGFRPGPAFSRILRAVEDQQLEGTLRSPEEAKDWVQREFGEEK